MIKTVFCDIDGCMGDFVKPEYPLKQNIEKNKKYLDLIKARVKKFKDVSFGVCTGRSFYQSDHIMEATGHQGLSVFEMGNVIFDPNIGVYNLFEKHKRFNKDAYAIKRFVEWKNQMSNFENTVKDKFLDSNIRQIKDRSCMLTYEFDKDIGNKLYEFLLPFMPVPIKEAIDKEVLKVLISAKSLDIMPRVNKGEAVSHLIEKYNINRLEVLAIGDSSHSDLDLLKSAGIVACPDNADEALKDFVLKNNGFIVPNPSSRGLLNILDLVENYIKFNQLKISVKRQ